MPDPSWSPQERELWLKEKRNWGRWGSNDEVGAMNLIDDQKRLAAAQLIQAGKVISLSSALLTSPTPEDLAPQFHATKLFEEDESAADFLMMATHTSRTHIDALNHVWGPDGLWNGRKASDVFVNNMIEYCDIDVWKNGIVTRGVLLDVPKHRGVPYVTLDQPVTGDEMAEIARAQGVQIQPGDAILLHCGREAYNETNGPFYSWSGPGFEAGEPSASEVSNPGPDITCLEFIRETDAAVLVWDMTECHPHCEGGTYTVHAAIWAYGVALVDHAALRELATACDELNRYECMLVIAPLRIRGGTASPVNPLAFL